MFITNTVKTVLCLFFVCFFAFKWVNPTHVTGITQYFAVDFGYILATQFMEMFA